MSMLNNPYRTSLTRDEIVAILLGWLDGPQIFVPMEDASPEVQELVESDSYCLLEDRENRLDDAYDKRIECLEKGQPAEICQKPVADFKRDDEALKRFCYEVDDEISKGDKSMLRVDSRSSTPRDICYTRKSFDEWRMKTPEIAELSRTGTKPTPRKKTKGMLQEEIILTCIKELGYEPTQLPRNESGRRGIKADVLAKIGTGKPPFETHRRFLNAWDRLRGQKKIIDAG